MSFKVPNKKRKLASGGRKTPDNRYWQFKAAKGFRNEYMGQYPQGSDASIQMWGPDYKSASDMQKNARKAMRYSGPGKYDLRTAAKYGIRGLGAVAGAYKGFLGGGYGGAYAGASKGWRKGAQVSKWAGFGAYDGSANQLINGPENQISVNASHNSGDIVFTNTEFFQNVYVTGPQGSNSTFQLQSFAINPGLQDMFPFLSQIAQNFELYEFEGLMVQYRPTSGEYGNNGSNSIGKVVVCTNYDPDAQPFLNSIQMENYDYANSCKPSDELVHGIETHPDQRSTKMLYVRTGDTKRDKIFTDMGQLQIATEGIPFGTQLVAGDVTALVGELWVTYKVRLSRSQLYGSLLGNNISSVSSLFDVAGGSPASTSITSDGNLTVTYGTAAENAIRMTLPSEIDTGVYLVTMAFISDSSLNLVQYTAITATGENCSVIANGNGGGLYDPGSTTAVRPQVEWSFLVSVSANGVARAHVDVKMRSNGPGTFPNGSFRVSWKQMPLTELQGLLARFGQPLPAPGVTTTVCTQGM